MTTRPGKWLCLAAQGFALLGAAGCGSSPPTRYYALSGAPPAGAAAPLPSGTYLQVDAVTIPPQLDRLQLVRQIGPNEVDVAGFERWAGPLDEQIRRALSEDLTDRTQPGVVIGIDAAAPPGDLTHVAVDIDAFAGREGGGVTLRAHWTLLKNGQALERQIAAIDEATSATDAGSIAAAMSAAIGQLADRIVAAVGHPSTPIGGLVRCTTACSGVTPVRPNDGFAGQ